MNHPFPGLFSKQNPPRRILIVRLSAHGDVIQTLPLLTALKKNWPQAEIGWLTEPSALPLLQYHPLINRLHVAHRPRWLRELRNPAHWLRINGEIASLLRAIREREYEVSLDIQGLLKSAVWPWLARIPIRAGFKASRESAASFYTHTLPPMNIRDPNTSAVQRYLDFARAMGAETDTPQFVLAPPPLEAQQKASALLAPAQRIKHPIVALAPFTRWPSKHWKADYWPRLLENLLRLDIQPVLLGGPADREGMDRILAALSPADRAQCLDLVGQTGWGELQVVLSHSALLVGPDSAPLHLADALGRRVIGLYGPTAPGRTGPIGKQHTLLSTALPCQPCFERRCLIRTHDCMTQLTPDIVSAMIQRTLFSFDPSIHIASEPVSEEDR